MEYRTEFNLTNATKKWKRELLQVPSMTYDSVSELESHLLDEIDILKEFKLSSEECFMIAKKRIGNIKELSLEYRKAHNDVYVKNKLTPYLRGILIFILLLIGIDILTNLLIFSSDIFGMNKFNYGLVSTATISILVIVYLLVSFNRKTKKNSIINRLNRVPFLTVLVCVFFSLKITLSIINSNFYDISYSVIFDVFLAHYDTQLLIGFMLLIFSFSVCSYSKIKNRLNIIR